LLAGLWYGGYLRADKGDEAALNSRLAGLERQIAAPAARPQVAPEPRETAPKAPVPDPALTARIAAVEASVKDLGAPLAAVNGRIEALQETIRQMPPAQAAVDAIGKRLDAIEQSAKTTQDKIAQNSGADAAARRALATLSLRDAVTRNAPYAAELIAVKNLGGNAQAIATLEPFAATGLASDAALSRELAALIPAMMKSAKADVTRSGGFIDRLQANAEKLVRIHPVGEPAGDDPAAVLARVEVKAARNDVAGATQEISALPANARAVAEPWLKKVAARNAALAAVRKLAADSAAALGAK
jgi:hypothetical protein